MVTLIFLRGLCVYMYGSTYSLYHSPRVLSQQWTLIQQNWYMTNTCTCFQIPEFHLLNCFIRLTLHSSQCNAVVLNLHNIPFCYIVYKGVLLNLWCSISVPYNSSGQRRCCNVVAFPSDCVTSALIGHIHHPVLCNNVLIMFSSSLCVICWYSIMLGFGGFFWKWLGLSLTCWSNVLNNARSQ